MVEKAGPIPPPPLPYCCGRSPCFFCRSCMRCCRVARRSFTCCCCSAVRMAEHFSSDLGSQDRFVGHGGRDFRALRANRRFVDGVGRGHFGHTPMGGTNFGPHLFELGFVRLHDRMKLVTLRVGQVDATQLQIRSEAGPAATETAAEPVNAGTALRGLGDGDGPGPGQHGRQAGGDENTFRHYLRPPRKGACYKALTPPGRQKLRQRCEEIVKNQRQAPGVALRRWLRFLPCHRGAEQSRENPLQQIDVVGKQVEEIGSNKPQALPSCVTSARTGKGTPPSVS